MRLTLVWAVAAILLASVMMIRTETISELVAAPHGGNSNLDGGAFYAALLQAGLIRMDKGRIILPPRDLALQEMAEARRLDAPWPPSDKAATERLRLIEDLYTPGNRQGAAVRRAVHTWNNSRRLVAIRDDRQGHADQPLQPGDRPNLFDAYDVRGHALQAAPVTLPEGYSYVNAANPPTGMGDWRVLLSPELPTGERVRLSSELAAGHASTLTIQVVGRLDPTTSRLPGTVSIAWRCRQSHCAPGGPAAAITITDIPDGPQQIILMVTPLEYEVGLQVPGLQLTCGADCRTAPPKWQPLTYPARVAVGREEIKTTDGVMLWRDGRATPEAQALNLLPIIGADRRHAWSLAGRLANRPDRGAEAITRLSIDSRVQMAAQDALAATIQEKFGDDRADDVPYRHRRRAALVVMHPNGAILAAGQWPPAPQGLSTWDFAAMAAGTPARDLLAPMGWTLISDGTTVGMLLGSTAKTILNLAVLKSAQDDPALNAAVQGCAPNRDGTLPCIGINLHQQSIMLPGQRCPRGKRCDISNFKGSRGAETLEKVMNHRLRSLRCVAGGETVPTVDKIGMAAAMAVSSNVYHIRVGGLLDLPSMAAYDTATRRRTDRNPDLPELSGSRFLDMASRLGFFQPLDLAGPAARHLGPGGVRDSLASAPARSELHDLTDPDTREDRMTGAIDALVMTSIGQRFEASPLLMTRTAAAIQTGRIPTPHLIVEFNGEAVAAPTVPLPIADLSPIRAGMKAVTESDIGTANEAFGGHDDAPAANEKAKWLKNQARCGVSGKTGSADLPRAADGKSLNVGWFVGYADAGVATPAPLSFACVMTPVHGLTTRTGGSTCAAVVADFLYRLGSSPTQPQ